MKWHSTAGGWLLGLGWAATLAIGGQPSPTDIPVVVAPQAAPVVRAVATELAGYLGRLYPATHFVLMERRSDSGAAILVGEISDPAIGAQAKDGAHPEKPESFCVWTTGAGENTTGLIAGADPLGTVFGVYALLEKLGCGFYLSYDALPPPRSTPFSFEGWDLADAPLVRDRIVFDWHNFLSGCSTWNLPEWKAWILQSQKQRFNAVMVHAYGNNPMVSFTFNGQTKPVGYLSTTVHGRDWSTMHVNDVRQLWGGQVFNEPIFGAAAAQEPETQRADAARKLMQEVFAYAGERAMDVIFADDVDTGSANPQELIRTLPEAARFPVRTRAGGLSGLNGEGDHTFWLANPDTPEGYAYYKTQVTTLLSDYPQITTLAAWFRTEGTPWMGLKLEEMPAAWQQEYQYVITQTPATTNLWHAPQIFALGKIVRACDRALKELGHARIQLAAGSWDFKFLAPCDRFFPAHVKLIGLDYNTLHGRPQLADADSRRIIRDVAQHRAVVPVIWAQHDDGNYIGRSYTPFAEFRSKLADAKADGFGIIHWTTRPLDLFFKSHAEQVWNATQDRPLHATCDEMAAKSFGSPARESMGDYLERWVTDAPKFARETSDYFIDRPLTNVAQVASGCCERLKLIAAVDLTNLAPEQRDRVHYFKGLEEFIAAIYRTQADFQTAQALLKQGQLAKARAVMEACHPEPVIEQFARFSSLNGMTRGEQGLVVSLNLRWFTHFLELRQQLGLEPVRYNFGPTSRDKLAQAAGKFTYYFDTDHHVWQTLGTEETGAETFAVPASLQIRCGAELPPAYEEICRHGIEIGKPLAIALHPIMKKDALPRGAYRLHMLMLDPIFTTPGQRVFDLDIRLVSKTSRVLVHDTVDIFLAVGGLGRPLIKAYDFSITADERVELVLTPRRQRALLCGLVVEPIQTPTSP